MFDFNTADASKPQGQLIPDKTVVVVVAKLRPGGSGPDGWLKPSNNSAAQMLDFEFTIDGGAYDRRKVWNIYVVDGDTEGHAKATAISRSTLRSMLESAKGVKPTDTDAEAQAKRQVKSYGDFDGLRFCAVIGVQKQDGYDDKNVLKYIITPDDKRYTLDGGSVANSNHPTAQYKAEGAKPGWAV